MLTPAQRHKIKALAEQQASRREDPLARASGDELMLAKLRNDQRRLKQVQSLELKAVVKRELLPDYAPYVEGVLAADGGRQDEVLMTVMVWRIDAGDYAGALAIAAHAIRHRLTMPDRYLRTTATVIAEEIADNELRNNAADQAMDAHTLLNVSGLTADEDMPDEVRAKLHKAIGYAVQDQSPDEGIYHLKRALQLHDKVGVKKDIERLERIIRNGSPQTPPPDQLAA
jgi:hypothetical protein